MDKHIRALRKEELLCKHGGWFDEENAERVVTWLVAAENRSPVVLIGAGFTRNARVRTTGALASPTEAPLWNDLIEPFAHELGVKPEQYDPPTLFELYQEAFGDGRLRDALRGAVADALLEPASAHHALAAYPCEAIVTTNCLDTLLDRSCLIGWRRVVVDADLSTSGSLRDLIYLHGHRDSSDSWIMTRSQYEDFGRTRPVIVARTRQLLAQHPWLVVGFGMTDPNFHAITRLLGREMRGHQPLSLALMYAPPTSAERQHWRKLGFEIASPARDREGGFPEFLEWAFSKLGTTYAASSEAARRYIERGDGPDAKLRRFREVHVATGIDCERVYREWMAVLQSLPPKEKQEEAHEAAEEARRVAWEARTSSLSTTIDAATPSEFAEPLALTLKHPVFAGLDVGPSWRPLASYEPMQCLDLLLADTRIDELAEHFAWGLYHHVIEARTDQLPMEVLAIRLARGAGWQSGQPERLHALLRAAVASARKYERDEVIQLLTQEAGWLGLDLPDEEDLSDQPHLHHAREGYRALLDANFIGAADDYARAATLASQAGLSLEEWAYTVGQHYALVGKRSDARDQDAEETKAQEQQLRDRRDALAKEPPVERWLERADKESTMVLREVVTRLQEREAYRVHGGWGRRLGGGGYPLWRSFRDLEAMHAPPALRRKYLEPLLPLLDAADVGCVLQNVHKPREWLREILSRPLQPTLEARQTRDTALVDVLLRYDGLAKTERIARLECLRELAPVLRQSDVPKALEWLKRASEEFRSTREQTAWGSQDVRRAYWAAFGRAVRWAGPSAAIETAGVLLQNLGTDPVNVAEAAKAFYSLPWSAWRPLEAEAAARLLAFVVRLIENKPADGSPRDPVVAEHALFALLRMLGAGLAPDAVTQQMAAWNSLLDEVRRATTRRFGEERRAGFLVAKQLAETLGPARDPVELFEEWFGPAGNQDDASTEGDRDRREELWAALADVVDDWEALRDRLSTEVLHLLKDEASVRYYAMNPHVSQPALRLLVRGTKHLASERARIGAFLVRILGIAPNYMDQLAEALIREWWDDSAWDDLMKLIVAACAGSGPKFGDEADVGLPTRRQLAALELFGAAHRGELQKDTFTWGSLQGFGLAALSDERELIANRAAFSVVSVAKDVQEGAEAKLYAAALRRIADDPRVAVRSAVAAAGPLLAIRAKSESVRDAARDAALTVGADDNAQVAWLLARARAEAENAEQELPAEDDGPTAAPLKPTEGTTSDQPEAPEASN